MRTVTIIAEQVSDRALTAALPTAGVASVVVNRVPGFARDAADAGSFESFESFQALRNPRRFSPNYRIELVVADDAVDSIFDGIAVAYGAGLFSDAEMWVNRAAMAPAA